jgi:chlorobactene glucosyltransferase
MNFVEFVILDTLVVLLLGALTFVFFFFLRKIQPSPYVDADFPFISVIVPVRNEEGKIKRCLESLLGQNYPRFELIIVDDRSTDDSARIIDQVAGGHPLAKILSCRESRPGWLGKCNALDYGSKQATGSWLAFIDADTYHHPNSLRDAISSAMVNQVDLISFMPVQELLSFWEQAIMPVLLGSFLLGDPLNKINDLKNPRAYAYGQYILMKEATYESIGGHESVKDQILDDIGMGRVVKSKGFRITAVDGRPLYTVRMYTNLGDLWRGWTKNLYALIDCNPVFLAGVLVLLNLSLLAPYVSLGVLIAIIVRGISYPPTTLVAVLLLVQFASIALWFWRTGLHYKGIQAWHFLIIPIGTAGLTLLYLYSAFCVISGFKVTWKDRRYCVNSSMKIQSELAASEQATKY